MEHKYKLTRFMWNYSFLPGDLNGIEVPCKITMHDTYREAYHIATECQGSFNYTIEHTSPSMQQLRDLLLEDTSYSDERDALTAKIDALCDGEYLATLEVHGIKQGHVEALHSELVEELDQRNEMIEG